MTRIDFYYWSDQCPYNLSTRSILMSLDSNFFSIYLHDVAKEPLLAGKVKMFSPTLLVFDNSLRWNGPITKTDIVSISQGCIPKRDPYKVKLGSKQVKGELIPLTEKTVSATKKLCTSTGQNEECAGKISWVKSVRESCKLPHLGLIHFHNNSCVGGAEFVPSVTVPYAIPKNETAAFLTCSFLSDEVYDYRSYPLIKLEDSLRAQGFNHLLAVASEGVVFPNGTLEWFIGKGYNDEGELYYEERDCAKMHLVRKVL